MATLRFWKVERCNFVEGTLFTRMESFYATEEHAKEKLLSYDNDDVIPIKPQEDRSFYIKRFQDENRLIYGPGNSYCVYSRIEIYMKKIKTKD